MKKELPGKFYLLEMAKDKSNISAEIICDSVNPNEDRLTTFILRGPRYLLAEVNTHRMLSRNAASSRAIPTERMIKKMIDGGIEPVYWGSNKPGMQSGDALDGAEAEYVRKIWHGAKLRAINAAEALTAAGLHKQWSNRVIEPWMQWTGLVSATDWMNFFALRAHKDAQPDFQLLAYRMLDAYLAEIPKEKEWGEWHLPFGDQLDDSWDHETKLKVCTARAARLSYETFEGEIDVEKDKALYSKLMDAHPLHASPAEMPAQAVPHLWLNTEQELDPAEKLLWNPSESHRVGERDLTARNSYPLPYDANMVHQGNYRGWTQWRKMQPHECASPSYQDLEKVLEERPSWITL